MTDSERFFNHKLLSWIEIMHFDLYRKLLVYALQWGAADAEIKVPSGENTELKHSPFIAWSRSVHSHTCYAYCQGFLLCLFLPFQSIHLHFFQNSPDFFLCWLWLTLVPVQARRIRQVSLLDAGSRVECPRNINRLKKTNMICGMMTCEMNNLQIG